VRLGVCLTVEFNQIAPISVINIEVQLKHGKARQYLTTLQRDSRIDNFELMKFLDYGRFRP